MSERIIRFCKKCNADTERRNRSCVPCANTVTREYRRNQVAARIAARLCIDCGAGLQDEDTKRCVECRDRNKRDATRWQKSQSGREKTRAWHRQWTAEHRPLVLERRRAGYMEHKTTGVCVRCREPSLEDSVFCGYHRDVQRLASRVDKARKANGRAPRPLVKKLREMRANKPQKPAPDITPIKPKRYVPRDVKLGTPRAVLLRAMRWLDWSRSSDVFEAADVPSNTDNPQGHNAMAVTLSRLVRDGLVEARGKRGEQFYRLSDSGRREADQLRNLTPGEFMEAA